MKMVHGIIINLFYIDLIMIRKVMNFKGFGKFFGFKKLPQVDFNQPRNEIFDREGSRIKV